MLELITGCLALNSALWDDGGDAAAAAAQRSLRSVDSLHQGSYVFLPQVPTLGR